MSYQDRRAERRHDAQGDVRLFFEDAPDQEIHGRLMDYSNNGFRAIHDCPFLHAGQLVRFRHVIASGTARVMWNRILPERVETGFLVVAA